MFELLCRDRNFSASCVPFRHIAILIGYVSNATWLMHGVEESSKGKVKLTRMIAMQRAELCWIFKCESRLDLKSEWARSREQRVCWIFEGGYWRRGSDLEGKWAELRDRRCISWSKVRGRPDRKADGRF